ncbi:hypothetical protein D4R51_03970 [bacterium]|nr:MAG: hypothetical protein D4R51_03970 [bacterium]
MTEKFGGLPPASPEEKPKNPEEERLSAEHFDDARYEKAKIEYDPLHKLLKEEAGLSEDEIAKFRIEYRTVESIKTKEKPEFEGQVEGTFAEFSNYHDLITFRRGLTPEEKESFDLITWGGEKSSWSGIAVFAVDLWKRANDPEDKLYQFRDKIREICGKTEGEIPDDEYAKAVAEGKIEPIEDLDKKEPANGPEGTEEAKLSEENQEKELSAASIERRFEKTFNIKREELESLERFNDLSLGQQALVLENLKQITLGRIEEEAVDRYSKGTTEKVAKYTAAAADAKFFGKIWHRIQAITTSGWRGALRGFYVAREEKRTAEEILHGGMATHGDTLKFLMDGMANSGPEVEVKEGGEIEILYAGKFENLTDDEQKLVSRCNIAAGKFATIPQEWSLPSATKKQQSEYNKAKADYDVSIGSILPLKEKTFGNERDAALAVADIERKVLFNQLLSRSPDVERKLKDIESNEVWARALNNVITERGLYAGFGYVARAATTSVLGLIAAPAVAAIVGGHIARRRAFETLHQEEKLGRRGAKEEKAEIVGLKNESKAAKEGYRLAQGGYKKLTEDLGIKDIEFNEGGTEILNYSFAFDKSLELSETQQRELIELHQKIGLALQNASRVEATLEDKQKGEKAFVNASNLIEKINLLRWQLDEATDNEKAAKIRGSLQARIDYAYDKLDKGLVNFGKTDEQLENKYLLVSRISSAEAEVAVKESEITGAKDEKGPTVTERLNRLTGAREARVTEAEKKFVNQQMIRGVVMGAGFAVLGYSIRHIFSGAPKQIEPIRGVPSEIPPQTPRTFSPAAPDTGTTYENPTTPIDTAHVDSEMAKNLIKNGVPPEKLFKMGMPRDTLIKAGVSVDAINKFTIDTSATPGSRTPLNVPPDSLDKTKVSLDTSKVGVPKDTVGAYNKVGGSPKDTLRVTVADTTKMGKIPADSVLSFIKQKFSFFANDSTFHKDSSGVITRQGFPGTYTIDKTTGDLVYSGGTGTNGHEIAPQVLKVGSSAENWVEAPPGVGVKPEQLELAKISKGEGVWNAVRRQLKELAEKDPGKFNLKPEELKDEAKFKSILNKETARILVENKILKPDGSEVRIRDIGTRVILRDGNKIEITNGKTYDWHPPKLAEKFESPLKGLRDTQWIDNQKMSILGNPSLLEKAGVNRWLVSDAADTYKGAVGELNDLAYVRGLSALEQENLLATGYHGAAQLDQWGLKPGTGGSFTSHFDSVLNSSKINELTQYNTDIYNDISKRVASASGIEWAKAGRMRVSDMIRWSKEPIDLKPGTFRLVETVSKFNPTRYEQTLSLDEFLKSKIQDGKTDFLRVLESTPRTPADTIGVGHQGSAGSQMVNEALGDHQVHKPPQAPEIEYVVTDKSGFEQIAPGRFAIKTENMTGTIEFIYGSDHNPVAIDANISKLNLNGSEFFKSDIGKLGEKTMTDGRLLSQYLEVYDKISKNPAYHEETSFLAGAIKSAIKGITKDAGNIINTEKLPEMFRP